MRLRETEHGLERCWDVWGWVSVDLTSFEGRYVDMLTRGDRRVVDCLIKLAD